MTSTSWQLVQSLVSAALDLPAEQRAMFLSEACGTNVGLRGQIEDLVRSYEEAGSFIENAIGGGVQDIVNTSSFSVGERIGPYRLIEAIGEGGMGAVYRAIRDDGQFHQHVAIKVMKSGFSIAPELVTRFRVERQILANLVHPNIARLLDGGITTAGLPYLVMEYIEGAPAALFVEQRGLDATARLDIFRQVCSAVQHAHQNLIVHRDIKPANILVTPGGVPKLLDFGIAKLLTPDGSAQTTLTRPAERLMTLEYASPEQIRGEPVTTATDVYSLGVLLYELLTGRRPFNASTANPVEMQRRICEDDPVRPKAVNPELAGELDAIIMKAIRKEPAHRYSSVSDLSADVDRYLNGFPVQAEAGAWTYRAGKYIRRNKAMVGTLLVLAGLLVGWIASLRTERAHTRQRFDEVRAMANQFLFRFDESIRDLQGSTSARKLIVAGGLNYLETLAADAPGDDSLAFELADGYSRIALIQYREGGSQHLGDVAGSIASLRREASLLEPLVKKKPLDRTWGLKLVDCHGLLAQALRVSGKPVREYGEYRAKALARLKMLAAKAPQDEGIKVQLAMFDVYAAEDAIRKGNLDAAEAAYRSALALRTELAAAKPDDEFRQYNLATSHMYLGDILGGNVPYHRGDSAGALREYSASEAILLKLQQRSPEKAQPVTTLSNLNIKRAAVLARGKDLAGALALVDKSLVLNRELVRRDPANRESARNLAISYANKAIYLARMGREAEMMRAGEEDLRLRREFLKRYPGEVRSLSDVATTEANFAEQLLGFHRYAQAEKYALAAVADWKTVSTRDPETPRFRMYVALSAKLAADAQKAQNRCRDALATLEMARQFLPAPGSGVQLTTEAPQLKEEINAGILACQGHPASK